MNKLLHYQQLIDSLSQENKDTLFLLLKDIYTDGWVDGNNHESFITNERRTTSSALDWSNHWINDFLSHSIEK